MNSLKVDLTNKYAVLKAHLMMEGYKDMKWRVVLCTGGFGCRTFTNGTAVFCKHNDGAAARYEGTNFARLATDDEIASFKADVWPNDKDAV